MMSANEMDVRLRERLVLDRRAEGDRLVLDDATLLAALDGSRALRTAERDALQASPLTARRLRQLALERRVGAAARWRGSRGMLRAASSGGAPAPIVTDDGFWTLHFIDAGGASRSVLQLAPQAPFAPALLAARAQVQVLDGAGNVLLAGRLDADGECEAAWPFAQAPALHLQENGAAFTVQPC